MHRSTQLHFGLDGIPLHEPLTGIGHYTLELARALARDAPLDEFEVVSPHSYWSSTNGEDDLSDAPPNLQIVQTEMNRLNRYWWVAGLPRYLRRHALTLFHGTNYEIPLTRACPTVLTIHDLSSFLYPQTHEAQRVRRARTRVPLMARLATMIVTPSESVRREVCERLRVRADKVVAVPEAARQIFRPVREDETVKTRKKLGVEDEFLLCVGTLEPRKNLVTLVRAYASFVREAADTQATPRLVIAGKKGWLNDELDAAVKTSSVAERICFTGYLTDEELRALFSSCRAFIYPSLYEGFGLPPLEAMACGAPVIASRIASLTEVTGGAARLFAPEDVGALAQEIVNVLGNTDERQHLIAAGLKRAAEFSWERTACATREVYEEALRRASKK